MRRVKKIRLCFKVAGINLDRIITVLPTGIYKFVNLRFSYMNSFVIPFFFFSNLWIKLSSGVLSCTSRKKMIDGMNAKFWSFQCDPLWPLRLYGGHLRSLLVTRLYFSGTSSYWKMLWVIWEASASRFYYDLVSPPPPSFYDTKRGGTKEGEVLRSFFVGVRRAFHRGGVWRRRAGPPPEVSISLPSFSHLSFLSPFIIPPSLLFPSVMLPKLLLDFERGL